MTSLVNINDACGDLLANPVFTDHLTRLQKNATGTSFPNSVVNWDFPHKCAFNGISHSLKNSDFEFPVSGFLAKP